MEVLGVAAPRGWVVDWRGARTAHALQATLKIYRPGDCGSGDLRNLP